MMVGKHAKKSLSTGPSSSITFAPRVTTLRPKIDWLLANGLMAAVESLIQALALELAPIRVNIFRPGAVAFQMWAGTGEDGLTAFTADVEYNVLFKRRAQPRDVAAAYMYTLNDRNLTGAVIKTDSGADLTVSYLASRATALDDSRVVFKAVRCHRQQPFVARTRRWYNPVSFGTSAVTRARPCLPRPLLAGNQTRPTPSHLTPRQYVDKG